VASFPLVSPILASHNASSASMRIEAPRECKKTVPLPTASALRVLRAQGGPPVAKMPRGGAFPLRIEHSSRQKNAMPSEHAAAVGSQFNVGGQIIRPGLDRARALRKARQARRLVL